MGIAETAVERLREFLRDRSLRATSEREAIVRAIASQTGHFDVDELVEVVRKDGIDASRATVYRALPLLMEAGIVRCAVMSGDRRRYEIAIDQKHHDHMMCLVCGCIVEFESDELESLQDRIAAAHGFEVTGHFHELVGRCQACVAKGASGAPSRPHA